jgi:hypothetical protein
VTNAACRVYNGIQHIPFPAVADPDGDDWLRRISPRHDRDHKFSAGYPPFEEEGAVSWMGIFDAFCRKRIAISINLVRLRVTGSRSLVRAHHKGGSRFAGCGLRAWPMGPAPPSPAPRRGRPPHPATALSVVRGPCECDGTILRYVGCQAVNVYHASSKSQPPASPAPVGGFLFRAGRRCRLVMMTDVRPSWRR